MINKNTLMKGKMHMVIKKQNNFDIDRINKIKVAVATRKYAHANEINILWQYAVKSSRVYSWESIMLIAFVSNVLICAITLCFF